MSEPNQLTEYPLSPFGTGQECLQKGPVPSLRRTAGWGLVKNRKVQVGDVDDFKLGVRAVRSPFEDPVGDLVVDAPRRVLPVIMAILVIPNPQLDACMLQLEISGFWG